MSKSRNCLGSNPRIRQKTDLFVIDGDLTTYKATIKERNLWIDMVIRMAEQAPVLIVSGNHGKESDVDLYALAKAKGKHSIYLSTEPELIEFDHVAVATFPTLARRIGLVHRRRRHARGLCRADGGVQSAIRTAARLLPLV